eukprot:m.11123 g.11123  ORF g.11123 m.11123 type:complete len:93 (+) comp8247_c0_seq2:155-433(+)
MSRQQQRIRNMDKTQQAKSVSLSDMRLEPSPRESYVEERTHLISRITQSLGQIVQNMGKLQENMESLHADSEEIDDSSKHWLEFLKNNPGST